ncbi:MAG: hypothetical protein AAGJ87_08720, partial [Pseudomonadota bacterium]
EAAYAAVFQSAARNRFANYAGEVAVRRHSINTLALEKTSGDDFSIGFILTAIRSWTGAVGVMIHVGSEDLSSPQDCNVLIPCAVFNGPDNATAVVQRSTDLFDLTFRLTLRE